MVQGVSREGDCLRARYLSGRDGCTASDCIGMDKIFLITLGVVGFVVFCLVLRRVVEWIGSPCQFCEQKTRTFRRLDIETQEAILGHSHEHERREPDRSGIFVCLNCRTIHDDYSGEKASWDIDAYGCVTFCKVCHAPLQGCEPSRDVQCPDCGTYYAWQIHSGSGFRFFTPPRDASILPRRSFAIDSR